MNKVVNIADYRAEILRQTYGTKPADMWVSNPTAAENTQTSRTHLRKCMNGIIWLTTCPKRSILSDFGVDLCKNGSRDADIFNRTSFQAFVLRAFVSRMVEAVDMNESRSYAHVCKLILRSVRSVLLVYSVWLYSYCLAFIIIEGTHANWHDKIKIWMQRVQHSGKRSATGINMLFLLCMTPTLTCSHDIIDPWVV